MIIIRNNDPKNPLIAKSSLSPKALGMLALILICPTPGLLTFDELVDSESGDEESVLEGLAELYESGYLLFFRWQTPGGNWVEEYLIFESPELRNKYLKTLPDDRKQYITSPMPKKIYPNESRGYEMKEPYFINLYSDLLQITGDVCSAQILELFEKWTLTRFEEGDKDLWLYTGIVNIKCSVYGDFVRNRIIRCLEDLHQKGFIESKASSETKDKTRIYKLNIENIQSAIKKLDKSGSVA